MFKAAVRFFQFYANERFIYVSATSPYVNQEIAVITQSLLELLADNSYFKYPESLGILYMSKTQQL